MPGLLLAGCGDSSPPAPTSSVPGKPVIKAVFVSARDCAESGHDTTEVCERAIDRAVAQHVASAPSYPNARLCEAEEGKNMCERTESKTFRPRLIAFLVTFANPVTGVPLYAHRSEPGFHTLGNKTTVLVSDEAYTFSRTALGSAEVYLKGG